MKRIAAECVVAGMEGQRSPDAGETEEREPVCPKPPLLSVDSNGELSILRTTRARLSLPPKPLPALRNVISGSYVLPEPDPFDSSGLRYYFFVHPNPSFLYRSVHAWSAMPL